MVNYQKILERITEERKKKGLSVYKLTELANLSSNTVYNWYNKKAVPTITALSSICEILDISLPELVSLNEKAYLSAQEDLLIQKFRGMTDHQRKLVLDLVKEITS